MNKIVNRLIVSASIAIASFGGYYAGDQLSEGDDPIIIEDHDPYYEQVRDFLSMKVKSGDLLSYEEMKLWIKIVNKEANYCGNIELHDVSGENSVNKVNSVINKHKCAE